AFVAEFVLHAFEQKVVPGQDCRRGWKFERFIAKFNVADAPPKTGMAADLNQQSLTVARGFRSAVRLDAHVVAQRAGEKNVVPSADMQSGNLDIREMFFDRPLFPIGVVIWMREPVEIVWREFRG